MSAIASKTNGRGPRVPLLNSAPPPAPEPASGHPTTPHLDAAVLLVQGQAAPLVRNATGQIGTRSYTYVTLANVVEQVLPLLVEADLLWRTWPTALDDGRPALRYRMTHVPSGECDEDTMPLPCDQTMQGLGSAITYGRRYALTAYLQLTIDEDDDGASANAGSITPLQRQNAQPGGSAPRSDQPTASKPKGGTRPATVKQRNMIKARAVGISDSQLADVILVATGNEPRQMPAEQAERWLRMGLERLPGTAVDAVLAGIADAGAEGAQR